MDLVSLATTAVGFILPHVAKRAGKLAAEAAGWLTDEVSDRIESFLGKLKRRFGETTYEGAVVRGVEDDPQASDRAEALKAAIRTAAEKDPAFAKELESFVKDVESQGGVAMDIRDAGAIAGRDVHQSGTNVAGRDQTIYNTGFRPEG